MNYGMSFSLGGALLGVRRTMPLAVGDLAVGIVFGVAARHAGLSPIEAVLMSGLVSAGTSQFVALGMWAVPLPALGIILTTMLVNLRHVLMGAALHPWFARLPARKVCLSAFFLTDETFALTLREFAAGQRDGAFMLGSGVLLVVTWFTGTWIGASAGQIIHDPAHWGLDFISIAALVAVLVGMWRDKSNLIPWIAAGLVAAAAARLLPGNWYILVGGLAGSLVGLVNNQTSQEAKDPFGGAIADAD
jgi:4-azaleucine resistance transporter AzlC